jgi:hypothetical protein
MKRSILNLVIQGSWLIFFSGCYGYSTDIQVSRNGAYSYRPHNRFVEVFFDDKEPARVYQQLAMIEVDGAEYEDNVLLLEKLRRRAQKLGADAVIKIRKSTANRERGDVVSAILFDEEPESYTATVLSGVAIKYIDSLQTGEWQ